MKPESSQLPLLSVTGGVESFTAFHLATNEPKGRFLKTRFLDLGPRDSDWPISGASDVVPEVFSSSNVHCFFITIFHSFPVLCSTWSQLSTLLQPGFLPGSASDLLITVTALI